MKKILFLGTHGQKNWGDELLLDTFTSQLGASVDKFYVNSYDPPATEAFLTGKNVAAFDTKREKFKLLRYLLQADALVFGGGSIIKELYTAYGGAQYGTLQVLDTLTKVARKLKKPIYFCNIGVGPIDSERGRTMAIDILNRGTYVTVRDAESFAYLKKWPLTVPYEQASDAVFSLDRAYFKLPTKQHTAAPDKTAPVIGINLCRNIRNNDNWEYFFDHLAADLIAWLKQYPGTKFIGLPMQYDVSNNNDHEMLAKLRDKVLKAVPKTDFDIVKPASLPEFAATIDSVDFMVAERLHALILSIVIGKPAVALEYDIKVTGLIGDLGLSEYGFDINEKFGEHAALSRMQKIMGDYAGAAQKINAAYKAHHAVSSASFDRVRAALAGRTKGEDR